MRSDDDTWDITTSVGATALGVAAMRARETMRPDALFDDPYARMLVEAVGSPQWSALIGGRLGEPGQSSEIDNARGSFVVARTCYFDRYFTDAAAAGIRQFVILAAGLDARAFRLEWPAGCTVFELDQPKVLEFKEEAFADHGVVAAADRRGIAIDLRQDWPSALRDNGFDPTARTAWLAEGLLRYLPADARERLFEHVAELSPAGSRFAANGGNSSPLQAELSAEARSHMMERTGIDLDVTGLFYDEDARTDPRDWFPAHGWTMSTTSVVDMMAELGRPIAEQATEMAMGRVLMTAVAARTRGDRTP